MKSCSIPDCGEKMLARDMCSKHYNRWKTHGDPLKCLKPLSKRGALSQWIEENCSSTSEECLIWPFGRHQSGYAKMTGAVAIRVMCERAHGAPPTPKHQVAHSCGRGKFGCINPPHLRWATVKQNHADKKIHGTLPHGEKHYNAKLTVEQVREIRAIRGTLSVSKIAAKYNVSAGCISGIFYGGTWSGSQ